MAVAAGETLKMPEQRVARAPFLIGVAGGTVINIAQPSHNPS